MSSSFFGSSQPLYGRSLTHLVRDRTTNVPGPVGARIETGFVVRSNSLEEQVPPAAGLRSPSSPGLSPSRTMPRSPSRLRSAMPAPISMRLDDSRPSHGHQAAGSVGSGAGSLTVPLLVAGGRSFGASSPRSSSGLGVVAAAAASVAAAAHPAIDPLHAATLSPTLSLPTHAHSADTQLGAQAWAGAGSTSHHAAAHGAPHYHDHGESGSGGGGGGGGGVGVSSLPAMQDAGAAKAVVFGTINALDPMFTPYVGSLCRFFFFSSAIHQTVFCLLSTLPFAVGQVQDVGLIFLSSMGSSIAAISRVEGLTPEVALGTTLITFSVATLTVGLLTMLVGRWRLAQLVMYVPLPVVGGYLGYVGYFCVAGGAALAAGVEINTVTSWVHILNAQALTRLAPLALSVAMLMLTMEHATHPLALPCVLALIPALFYVVLFACGLTLADAQDAGWVMAPTEGSNQPFWQLWDMFNVRPGEGWDGLLRNTYWPALLAQVPKMTGLFLVVCFGSCMDVAAIQQDVPRPLDFDRELVTVGVSNMVTALLGAGYTGSYIFSQTVFTLRAGVFNRLNGVVVAAMEFAVFAVPFSVVQFVPSFYFGALLLWFGVDIVRDWLIFSYRKLSTAEYILLWASFVAIMLWGLEAGIGAGIVMATLAFAYQYAESTVSHLSPAPASSGNMHSYSRQAVLEILLPRRVVALSLSGFIFFGNSISISTKIEKIAADMVATAVEDAKGTASSGGAAPGGAAAGGGAGVAKQQPGTPAPASLSANGPEQGAATAKQRGAAAKAQRGGGGAAGKGRGGGGGGGGDADDARVSTLCAMADAPMFIILDLRLVPTLDATAAKTFAALSMSMASRGIQVLVCGISPSRSDGITRLLTAHGMHLVPHAPLGGDDDEAHLRPRTLLGY
ncbi:hypothetical protein FOA52_014384 [Chlamydomonas sp. UWO 241]|nr:hypothetical protein FOA52_014384 [Chlamydomonas sp. UWO 241]